MTQPTKKPSDQSTPDPWNDLDIVPTAPGKDHYAAGDLYTVKPGTTPEGMGLIFFWVGHPLALPVFLVGAVLLLGMTWMKNHDETLRQEAANGVAIADMNAFKSMGAKKGLEAACLATPRDRTPLQYRDYCVDVVKAHATKKGARP